VEAEGTARLARFGEAELNVDALVDWTRASIIGEGPVPRVPPLRVLGGVDAVAPAWSVRAEVEHATRQSRVADFETETPAFTLVNLSASLRPFGDANRTTLVLSVNNLFDVEARRHTSFLKDFAPLAGRDIRLSLRVSL
jgi:iron complex outermembrane receptor protein